MHSQRPADRGIGTLLGVLAVLGPVLSARDVAQHRRWSVRFVYQLDNRGRGPLRDLRIRLQLPEELRRQRIEFVAVSDGALLETDIHGNRVAVVRRRQLAPGQRMVVQWFATVDLSEPPMQVDAKPGLAPAQRKLYLRDRRVYQLQDPRIVAAAKAATAGRETVSAKIAGIHDLVTDRLRYVRDGHWDPAPDCLATGTGSCSEYSYCFIALARAVGIPARWAGGLALRKPGGLVYEDSVFHRWVEVWVDGRGWMPVDCSRDDGESGSAHKKPNGKLPWNLLVLSQGDGGEGSLTGDYYHALGTWSGRGGRSRRRGYWTRGGIDEDAFAAMREALAKDPKLPEPAEPGQRQVWLFHKGVGLAPLPDPEPVRTLAPHKSK